MALHRRLGDRHEQADTLARIGDTHQAAGERDAAREAGREALMILTEIDHPDTRLLRSKLEETTARTSVG
jgi:predicted TPR repeat methyltransferase